MGLPELLGFVGLNSIDSISSINPINPRNSFVFSEFSVSSSGSGRERGG